MKTYNDNKSKEAYLMLWLRLRITKIYQHETSIPWLMLLFLEQWKTATLITGTERLSSNGLYKGISSHWTHFFKGNLLRVCTGYIGLGGSSDIYISGMRSSVVARRSSVQKVASSRPVRNVCVAF